jgi:hypothetical protein
MQRGEATSIEDLAEKKVPRGRSSTSLLTFGRASQTLRRLEMKLVVRVRPRTERLQNRSRGSRQDAFVESDCTMVEVRGSACSAPRLPRKTASPSPHLPTTDLTSRIYLSAPATPPQPVETQSPVMGARTALPTPATRHVHDQRACQRSKKQSIT